MHFRRAVSMLGPCALVVALASCGDDPATPGSEADAAATATVAVGDVTTTTGAVTDAGITTTTAAATDATDVADTTAD